MKEVTKRLVVSLMSPSPTPTPSSEPFIQEKTATLVATRILYFSFFSSQKSMYKRVRESRMNTHIRRFLFFFLKSIILNFFLLFSFRNEKKNPTVFSLFFFSFSLSLLFFSFSLSLSHSPFLFFFLSYGLYLSRVVPFPIYKKRNQIVTNVTKTTDRIIMRCHEILDI